MNQEDSNGESSFEIIDKKQQILSPNNISGTSSSISSYSIVSPPTPSAVTTGNLLSNVAPPVSLPDFSLYTGPPPIMLSTTTNVAQTSNISSVKQTPAVQITPQLAPQIVSVQPVVQPPNIKPLTSEEQFPVSQFSAAIPPSKGIPQQAIGQQSTEDSKNELRGGFMGAFKDAFSGGGVLSRMAEKAKNSMDTIITTLDPQMSEYIYSGGDTEITVTSEKEDEVSAIREAVHCVFGKAWVNGVKLNMPAKKYQAVGFDQGIKNAEEKLEYSLKFRKTPTIAIENILFQQNEWYNVTLLVLKDAEKQITLKTFSHSIPLPVEQILKAVDSSSEYKSLTTEQKLTKYIYENPSWRETISGSTDKEIIHLPAKTLIKFYKAKLSSF